MGAGNYGPHVTTVRVSSDERTVWQLTEGGVEQRHTARRSGDTLTWSDVIANVGTYRFSMRLQGEHMVRYEMVSQNPSEFRWSGALAKQR